MADDLKQLVCKIGKDFGYAVSDVDIETYLGFPLLGGEVLGAARFYNENNSLKMKLLIDENLDLREKEFVIAHEFCELKDGENHPRRHKLIKYLRHPILLILGIGFIFGSIYDTVIDGEARKRGYKIPYSFHWG